MKTNDYLVFLLFITISGTIYSQEVSSKYTTNSLTTMMVKFDEYEDENWAFEEGFYDIDLSNKYFSNPIGIEIITQSGKKQYIANFSDEIKRFTPREKKFAKRIMSQVEAGVTSAIIGEKALLQPLDTLGMGFGETIGKGNKIATEILTHWAKKDSEGNFTVLNERSESSLNTVDLKNKVDHNKLDAFKDLFYNNYILLFDFGDIIPAERYVEDYPYNAGVNANMADYIVEVNTYVYKLDIDDAIFEQIKTNFRTANFRSIDIPIKYVGRYLSVAESGFTNDNTKQAETPQQRKDRKSRMYKELAQKSYDEIIELAEMHIEDFKLKTKVSSGFPSKIKAEVGLNENVRLDQRYFAYQNVENSETGQVQSELVGAIRVAEVIDNISDKQDASGSFKETRFNQIWGRPVKEGMFLVQENDFGVGLSAGLRTLTGANLNFRMEYRVSEWLQRAWKKSPLAGTNLYADLFFVGAAIEGSDAEIQMSMGIGVSTRFYVNKWLRPEPYLGIYLADGFSYLNLGVRADYPLKHNIFLVPEIGISTAKRKNDSYLPVVVGLSIKHEL